MQICTKPRRDEKKFHFIFSFLAFIIIYNNKSKMYFFYCYLLIELFTFSLLLAIYAIIMHAAAATYVCWLLFECLLSLCWLNTHKVTFVAAQQSTGISRFAGLHVHTSRLMRSMSLASSSTSRTSGPQMPPESLYIFWGRPVVKTMKFHALAAGTVICGLISVRKDSQTLISSTYLTYTHMISTYVI